MKLLLGRRILAEIPKQKKESSIIVPDTVKKDDDNVESLDTHIFKVLDVGKDVEHVQPGDTIHILPRGKNVYKIDGKLLFDESEVVLVERDG